MNFIKKEIDGLYVIEPKVFSDARGYFYESFVQREFDKVIGAVDFVQENQSRSLYGVVRGLHFQTGKFAQAKLVSVVHGTVLDVAVDIRRDSATFGKYVAVELSEQNHLQFYMPRGFAHGFSVLSKEAVFQYKCDNYYSPGHEGSIAWNDASIGIDWRVPADKIVLSEKDRANNNFINDLLEL